MRIHLPVVRGTTAVCALLAGLALFPLRPAAAGTEMSAPELLRENHCHGCHDEQRTLIGPSYRAIAERHAARRDVMIDILAGKIIHGGGGNWGVVPMVFHERLTMDQARAMARWILERK